MGHRLENCVLPHNPLCLNIKKIYIMGRYSYLSGFQKSILLLLLGLGLVLGKQGEQSSGLILGKRSVELIDRGRNLQSGHQQLSLTLDSYVTRPAYESGEIFLCTNSSSDSGVFLCGREPVMCVECECMCVCV